MVLPTQPSSMNLRGVTRPEGALTKLKIKKVQVMRSLLKKISSFVDPRNDLFLGFSRAEFLRKLED